jgi:hypothetical protein
LNVSLLENPITTILRLLENRIVVIKENGEVAFVRLSECDFDRELLKDCDAQVVGALDSNRGVKE